MEKLTPKQRQTIVKIENAFADNPKGLTLEELQHATLISFNVIVKTLPFIDGLQEFEGVYSLPIAESLQETPTAAEVVNADLTEEELKEQEAKKQATCQMLDQLKKSASSILTQDSVGTANPAYVVKSRKKNFGIDENFSDKYVWRDLTTGEGYIDENDGDLFWALTELSRETGKSCLTIANGSCYEKCHYEQVEVSETVCFTRDHAQDYIDANCHNLSDPFIYVESFNRNHEMLAIRQLLMLLAKNPTMLDGALLNA